MLIEGELGKEGASTMFQRSPEADQLILQAAASRESKNIHHPARWLSACAQTGGRKPAGLQDGPSLAPDTLWWHCRGEGRREQGTGTGGIKPMLHFMTSSDFALTTCLGCCAEPVLLLAQSPAGCTPLVGFAFIPPDLVAGSG